MSTNTFISKTLNNRYKISAYLGGGGFGDTYLANDLHLPEKPICVVKHLKIHNLNYEKVTLVSKLFDKEAKFLYKLGNSHPQIPQLLAHFSENGEFYLVQEFIDGYDLTKEIISGTARSEAEVSRLIFDILEVLTFVHEQGVIHRDIKPQNLMRGRDRKIVLIDFGAVKEIGTLGASPQGQTSRIAIGTPGYMPAEQQDSHPQFSSDIYAVGIVAFQALTGLEVFKLPRDKNNGELHCALFPDINISPSFAQILDTMVRYDYRQRYKDASVALNALHQYLDISQAPTLIISPILIQSSSTVTPATQQNPSQSVSETSIFQKVLQFFQQLFSDTPNAPSTTTIISTHATHLEQPEGQVSLKSLLYIERVPIENDCYEEILRPGALIRIKAPRQMGKTSLLTRVLDHSQQQGFSTAYLNFQSADAEFFTSLDKFLQWFCGSIAQELNLKDRLSEYWQGVLGSKDKCTNYFQRYLLSEINTPIVLGLDEVDQIFQYPQVASEFFALLRAWHETSKNKEIWKKLRLVIVHSKEVYIPLNINQSPFNVGLPIDLPEFSELQVKDLVQRHNLSLNEIEIKQLIAMVGGHPYLVRKALYEIACGKISLSQLLQIAPTEEGMYSDHLRRHLYNLQEDAKLVAAIKQVIVATQPIRIESSSAFKLRSMGLVKFQGNDVIPLCDLYRLYFQENLG